MVDTLKLKTDLIILQEHWLCPSKIERLNNNNYTHEVFVISSVKDDFTVKNLCFTNPHALFSFMKPIDHMED